MMLGSILRVSSGVPKAYKVRETNVSDTSNPALEIPSRAGEQTLRNPSYNVQNDV